MYTTYDSHETVRLTMAQALVRFMNAQHSEFDGVRQRFIQGIWGIFGHGNVSGLSQAIHEYGGPELPYHQPFNEQAQVHAAAGFAKAKRRLATMACTTSIGPGATNMITGAATATIDRIPVLLLPSDYFATRHQGQILQDVEHPVNQDYSVTDCFRPAVRFFDRITRPEQLLFSLPEAFRILTDPAETGAVCLALCQDIQNWAFDYPTNFFRENTWLIERRPPTDAAIELAADLLAAARAPLIIAGGGVRYSQAEDTLTEFAERFGVPVAETYAGRSAISRDSGLLLGGIGTNGTRAAAHAAENADLVICVGTRLADYTTGSNSIFQNPNARFIAINVNPRDAIKLGAHPVVADAALALERLEAAAANRGASPNRQWLESVGNARRDWRAEIAAVQAPVEGQVLTQPQVIGILNRHARAGDVLIAAAGTPVGEMCKLWDGTGGRTAMLEFGNSCMGYEIPAAIGVRKTDPPGEVFVHIGDGGFLMHPSELITALQERAKITVIIVRNLGFQSIHAHQRRTMGHSLGNEFRWRDPESYTLELGDFVEIPFAEIAAGMGARSWSVNSAADFAAALEEARAQAGPCLIEVDVDKYATAPSPGVWWDVYAAEVSNDPVVVKVSEESQRGRARQRFYW
jgi:3D-(3,5/4)-trihydroxycyclohexane-1,2-dione acylhydrolase (decyclizing)